MRDEFSAKTVRILAARVGYHCSNPDCLCATSGPALDESRTVNVGVGAHIAAAAPGGKRYDQTMTPAERSGGTNGIWLCQSCSKLIDSDEQRYTVALLLQWKKDAIQRALDAVASGGSLGPIRASSALDAADEEFLRGLDLPSADAVDTVGARLRVATQTDVAAFRAARPGPARTLALTLRLRNSPLPNVSLESVGRMTALAEPIAVVAPGGTGKSTTLIQLGEFLGSGNGVIPLLVPLGEWSVRQEDFFDSIARRNAFGTFRRQHLMQLAYYGRVVLLLDGWNELTPEARLRATNDIAALRRDYPQLGLVLSSRREALPVSGSIIEIETLSQDQQLELARTARGQEGTELVDRAWRTAGVRELVSIPLYLNALLALPAGARFPETKEAVLRMFVEHNETTPDKIERLQRDTFGQHEAMLVGLAVAANRDANTVISDSNANRTVSAVVRRLSDDGQIQAGATPQPRAIVDGLVGAHLLMRAPGPDGAIRFQHQLFQEWYAAAEVEQLMLKAAAGDADARKHLREDIFDWPSWEESILFACDRLSRAGDAGARAVAAAIDDTLRIDPLLAAAMIDRASDPVWQNVLDGVVRFVRRWHMPGKIDRAVRFMITCGKPEFADLLWPLASNADDQLQFEAFRAADRFRPNVLGPERELRLRALPYPQRTIALSEIASESGFDGMELAATLALTDPDPRVVANVVDSLAFRRGDRLVNRIMQSASDAVWSVLARGHFRYHLTDAQLDMRLTAERDAERAAETRPTQLLDRIAEEKPTDAGSQITALLGAAEEDFKDGNFGHAIERAYSEYPDAVTAGLVARIAAGLPLPYRVGDYLENSPLIDAGPVAEAALEPSTSERRLEAAAAIIGPVTVAALFDQLIANDEQLQTLGRYDELLSNEHRRLVGALAATRQDVFAEVILSKGQTDNPRRIGLLADALSSHGISNGNEKLTIDARQRTGLRSLVEGWIETLRIAPQPERHAASEVALATAKLADPDLAEPLRQLLERDLADYSIARTGRLAGTRGQNDTGYTLLYARAFAAMHDASAVAILKRDLADLRWGIEAAGALYEIWSVDQPPEEKRIFGGSADFSRHLTRKTERAASAQPSSEFAEAIFAVVRTLGDAAKTNEEQQHAIALAVIGLALPHGVKGPEIETLLGLPQPITSKQRLLMAAARAGETIPVALVMDGLCSLLAAAKTETWRLDENRGELAGWINLFPFSDDPPRVHEALALLPEPLRRPRALHRLLDALPQGPTAPALATLERMAEDNPAFLQEFEWMNALIKLDTEAAALALLGHTCAGRIPVRDGFRISRALSRSAQKHATVRAEIIARYRALPAAKIRRVLEMAMDDLTDEDMFMALFEGHSNAQHPTQGVVRAVRNLAIGRRSLEEWTGAFEEFGVPLTGLRARLFAMLPVNDARARLAKDCLIAIEEYRDERGRVSNEPRHPDISTGRAWPPEADE